MQEAEEAPLLCVRFQQSEYSGYRLSEFTSLALMFQPGARVRWEEYDAARPLALVRGLSVRAARLVSERATQVKEVYEVLLEGEAWEGARREEEAIARFNVEGTTFKMVGDRYGASWPFGERKQAFHQVLKGLAWKPRANMREPQHVFALLEHVEDTRLLKVVMGRRVDAPHSSRIEDFRLNARPFINTTSMNALVAFAMANIAQVRPGDLVVDPFVGSGSVTLACSEFGAFCLGMDADPRVLRGKNARKCPAANYAHYGIPMNRYLGGVRADFSLLPLREDLVLDAIVTDPPYGVRESIKKTGRRSKNRTTLTAAELLERYGDNHVPQRVTYDYMELIDDLMAFAARALKPGGRLVFFLAVKPEDGDVPSPEHAGLTFVSRSPEVFPLFTRILFCYKKTPIL